MTETEDFYLILGVAVDANFDALKKAYRAKAKTCHPDLHGGSAESEAQFKRLVQAFDVLSDPDRRSAYDQHRQMADAWETPAHASARKCNDWASTGPSVLDTMADDVLEELIVGASIPFGTTLQSLMRDLEHTERFLRFREVKNLFHNKKYVHALRIARLCVADCPGNILYQFQLGQCQVAMGRYKEARKAWSHCIQLGASRNPSLALPRVHRELDRIKGKGNLLQKMVGFFSKPAPMPMISAEDQLLAETSRAMTRLIAKDVKNRNKKKPEGHIPQISDSSDA